MKKFVMILLLTALLSQPAVIKAESKGILYRVSGGSNTVYLLGSIHVGFAEMYPFGSALQQAMDESDVFVFECDTDGFLAQAAIQNGARYHAGDGLRAHVSEETIVLLNEVASLKGLNLKQLETYKPWAVTSVLSSYTIGKLVPGADEQQLTELGVEVNVKAQGAGKTCLYLETVQEQIDAMNQLSDTLQEEMLRDACEIILDRCEPSGMNADVASWGEWWKNGDAEAFAASYRKDEGYESSAEYRSILLTERNDRMAERILPLLEGEESHTYLITVGLMHLVMREDSILTRLEEAGYHVEQIL